MVESWHLRIDVWKLREKVANGVMFTKQEFDRLMVRGWKEHRKGYIQFELSDACGKYYDEREIPTKFCALGVVAHELGYDLHDVWGDKPNGARLIFSSIPTHVQEQIVRASNNAGSKTLAIRDVKAIQW